MNARCISPPVVVYTWNDDLRIQEDGDAPSFYDCKDYIKLVRHVGSAFRAHIFKRLWSLGIDSKESIPPAYVA
jgi:hypothetical protein